MDNHPGNVWLYHVYFKYINQQCLANTRLIKTTCFVTEFRVSGDGKEVESLN